MLTRRRIRTVLIAAILVSGCTAAGSPGPSPSASPQPVTKATTQHDIRVTLTLEGPPVAGQLSWADGRVDDLGAKAVRWAGADQLETFGEVTVAPDGSITAHRFEP
jgi:hypothetical protein